MFQSPTRKLPKYIETMWRTFLVVAFFFVKGSANDCVTRSFGIDQIVCVCNATYCDGLPKNHVEVPEDGSAYWYVSNKKGLRMKLQTVKFNENQSWNAESTLIIDETKKYQKVLGFGGAFTDSVGINIKKLSPATQDQLLRAYYDPKTGCKYSLGRIPIGGTDFSTRPYAYDDVANDTSLKHFALAQEDYDYKLPFARRAVELNPEMKFTSAVWSPPTWMKTNNEYNGRGFLKTEYYQVYADYMLKFVEEYKKNGVDIAAVSTGNEPSEGIALHNSLSAMGWTAKTVAKWIADNLGPTLAESEYNQTRIWILDDQRSFLPEYIEEIAENKRSMKYVEAIASHWYRDPDIPPSVLTRTHDEFPDKFLIMTEACIHNQSERPVVLGSWDRGERYILSILEYMNHWYVGWVDWNIALDKKGGPNWIKNYVDAPIIIDPKTDEFYKQPMYYALMHFSRFVDRDSVKISITDTLHIKSTAFVTPSNEVVVVLYNRDLSPKQVVLKDAKKGSLCLELSPQSMNTIKYKQ
ncbi:lysosomal acid glucosylceramidase-like [Colletes latitarsis]|uniref:lysosomal acid glucosylceramidase-like n=1 Tax=Colletes latitarsis TaxID=2605962 RepID=UPI0040365423